MDRPTTDDRRFWGDLGDPWVAQIAAAMPGGSVVEGCAGDLPDAVAAPTSCWVVHRAIPSKGDLERLAGWAEMSPRPRVLAILGPHSRHFHWERVAGLVDRVVPESTAEEVLGRWLGVDRPRPSRRPPVAVVAGGPALREVLVAMAEAAGYAAHGSRAWADAGPGSIAVWDAPTLDPGWEAQLARESRTRRVVALLAFADRETVAAARRAGARAVLDLPVEPEDLAFALDRLAATLGDPPYRVPPPPRHGHHQPATLADRAEPA